MTMNRLLNLIVFGMLLIFSSKVSSQGNLSGRVVDKSGQPVDMAMVYINGTTLGTQTTTEGFFELKNVSAPCNLVVSRLGFETLKVEFAEITTVPLTLTLETRDLLLTEVSVQGIDQRAKLLQTFLTNFLGMDTWGANAHLINDSVLIYKVEYNEDSITPAFSGNLGQKNLPWALINRSLTITAKEPLKIDLPLLGYHLTIDLDFFSFIRTNSYFDANQTLYGPAQICRYLGSYFMQPYEDISNSNQKRFERNRKEAFYNSKEHFCRSLYSGELLKNGFLFLEERPDTLTKKLVYLPVNLDTCFRYDGNGTLRIFGLAGKSYQIHYFSTINSAPIDLSKRKYDNVLNYFRRYTLYYKDSNRSYIHFLNDTCSIRKSGIIPDNSISFSGKNNYRKVGATLPDNYTPEEE